MTVKYKRSPNPNVEWTMHEWLDGYNANWTIYKVRTWQGLMIRLTYSTGHKEEPLPLWFGV